MYEDHYGHLSNIRSTVRQTVYPNLPDGRHGVVRPTDEGISLSMPWLANCHQFKRVGSGADIPWNQANFFCDASLQVNHAHWVLKQNIYCIYTTVIIQVLAEKFLTQCLHKSNKR